MESQENLGNDSPCPQALLRSRAANKRKARMLAKGEANADKNKHKIGRTKGKFGVNKLRRKMKNAP